MSHDQPVESIHQSADILRLPQQPALQHTMLLYDAAVGLVRAMAAGISAEGLKWGDFGLLLEMHRMEGANSEGVSGVSRAAFLSETQLSESILVRAIKRLSGPNGWLETFTATGGGTDERGASPHLVQRDRRRHFVPSGTKGLRQQARLRFSASGLARWGSMMARLEKASGLWLRGLDGPQLLEHRFVLWAWCNRLEDLQAARRASLIATTRPEPTREPRFGGSLNALIAGISSQSSHPDALPLADAAQTIEQSITAPGSRAPVTPAAEESSIQADPMENVFEVVRTHRRITRVLASLLENSGLTLQEADVLSYLGIAAPSIASANAVPVAAKEVVGGWFEYSALRSGLYYVQGMTQPQFSRLLANVADADQGRRWIEFSWELVGKSKKALPDAPVSDDLKPDLVRRWLRLTREGYQKILPVWEDYVRLSEFLCNELPTSWLESLDGINLRLAAATPSALLPTAWNSSGPIREDGQALQETHAWLGDVSAPARPQDSSMLSVAFFKTPAVAPPPLPLKTAGARMPFVPGSPPLREVTAEHNSKETTSSRSQGGEPASTDPLIRLYLETLVRLDGNATHQEILNALTLDSSRYWELFTLMRHRGYVSGHDGGLTVQLGPKSPS